MTLLQGMPKSFSRCQGEPGSFGAAGAGGCSSGGFLVKGDRERCLEGLGASGHALAVVIPVSAFACAS